MRTIACIVSPFVLAAAAACNTTSSGENDRVQFTPTACGNPLLGCDFAAGVVAGGALDVELRGVDGFSVDGLTVVSASPSVLAVTDIADGAAPTWGLTALAAGTATLSVLDAASVEVDAFSFEVAAAERLALRELAGDAIGPTEEPPYDEAWEVPADELVSFQAQPMRGNARLIGRLDYVLTVPSGSTLLDNEQSSSDPTIGYLYVQPAAGDHAFTFAVVGDAAPSVDVVLHAR